MADTHENKNTTEDNKIPESPKYASQKPERHDGRSRNGEGHLINGQDWMEIKMSDAQEEEENGTTARETSGVGSTYDEHTSHESTPSNHQQSLSTESLAQHPPAPPEKDSPSQHPPPIPEKEGTRIATRNPNIRRSHSMRRSDTQSTINVNGMSGSIPLSSIIFVVSALEHIAASKEARKRKPLGDAVHKALAATKQQSSSPDPEIIFEPLRLATETPSVPLTTAALDCIGKLISYSYFSVSPPPQDSSTPTSQGQKMPLIDRAIETICECFQDEATPAEVQLQIVKSLLAAVLNDKFIVHGSGLLKAVRQVYNIFLLSKSSANQQVAQGTLTQMVGTVFERVTARLSMKEARTNMSRIASEKGTANGSQVDVNGNSAAIESNEVDGGTEADGISETSSAFVSDRPARKEPGEKLTLQSFENAKIFDDARIGDNAPTMITQAKSALKPARTASGQQISLPNGEGDLGGRDALDEDEEDEIFVKDAYLVFRSMCRLSIKQLQSDQQQDIKSSNMRSKLISLAIIRTLLNNNMVVFTSSLVTIRSSTNNEPTGFGQAVNQYLRLSLSKNGASSVRQVFESCCEIFWLMLKDMRIMLKVLTIAPLTRLRCYD